MRERIKIFKLKYINNMLNYVGSLAVQKGDNAHLRIRCWLSINMNVTNDIHFSNMITK